MRTLLFGFCCCLLITGCSILPTPANLPVNEYDIVAGDEAPIQLPKGIVIGTFSTAGPYSDRMVFRTGDSQIMVDEYNRWSQGVPSMFKRFFLLRLRQSGVSDEKVKVLQINVLRCDCSLDTRTVTVSLLASLTPNDSNTPILNKVFSKTVQVDEVSGASFAKAVAQLTDQLVQDIASQLANIE